MRSSKSRSRNKSNRNRSVGNAVNRVFDSSGPEGKVRGTPQQIIDKYTQLARDAQLGNDRVAFENFQQHAEHYQRMFNEAQREQEVRREEHERQNRERQGDRDRDRGGQREQDNRQREDQQGDPARSPQPDIIEPAGQGDSGLVETPEAKSESRGEGAAAPRKPTRKPRNRKPSKPGGDGGEGGEGGDGNDGARDGDKAGGDDGGKAGSGGPDLSAGSAEAAE